MTAERYRSRYPATDDVNKLLVAPGNTVRSTPTDYATASILKGSARSIPKTPPSTANAMIVGVRGAMYYRTFARPPPGVPDTEREQGVCDRTKCNLRHC
jgi:hypothetical protein